MPDKTANIASARELICSMNSDSTIPQRPTAGDAELDSAFEIFHEASKYHRSTLFPQALQIAQYLNNPVLIARTAAGYNSFPYLKRIELPPLEPIPASLGTCLSGRTSCRKFGERLSLEQVSAILGHSLLATRSGHSEIAKDVEMRFRPYPSAGNLNALETYVFLNKIEGVDPCTAHYDQRNHCLRILKKHSGAAFAGSEISRNGMGVEAPLIVVMTIVPQRLTKKYGARGYRFALLEAGHAAQNLCLVAEGLQLGSLVYGAFYDDELAAELQIDGVTETVATVVLIGPRQGEL